MDPTRKASMIFGGVLIACGVLFLLLSSHISDHVLRGIRSGQEGNRQIKVAFGCEAAKAVPAAVKPVVLQYVRGARRHLGTFRVQRDIRQEGPGSGHYGFV